MRCKHCTLARCRGYLQAADLMETMTEYEEASMSCGYLQAADLMETMTEYEEAFMSCKYGQPGWRIVLGQWPHTRGNCSDAQQAATRAHADIKVLCQAIPQTKAARLRRCRSSPQ